MYASLIGAGISQLNSLINNQTNSKSSASSTFNVDESSSAQNTGSGISGTLSNDLQKLLVDLQSTTTSGAQATDGSAKPGAGGAHHHHAHAASSSVAGAYANTQSLSTNTAAATTLTA